MRMERVKWRDMCATANTWAMRVRDVCAQRKENVSRKMCQTNIRATRSVCSKVGVRKAQKLRMSAEGFRGVSRR